MQDGKFCWYELLTTDTEAAKAFYGEMVGWKTEPFEGAPMPYTVLKFGDDDQGIGGIMDLPEEVKAMGAPPHWHAHVKVSDCDAAVARVKELGGSVKMDPHSMPGVGRFAVIACPAGSVLSVFHPEGDYAPTGGQKQTGHFTWNELLTADVNKSWAFYSALFGWQKLDSMTMPEGGEYQMYGYTADKESMAGGFYKKPDEMPMSSWLYYVTVADLDRAVEQCKQRGGSVDMGPMDVPGGDRVAICADGQGARFGLHAAKA